VAIIVIIIIFSVIIAILSNRWGIQAAKKKRDGRVDDASERGGKADEEQGRSEEG